MRTLPRAVWPTTVILLILAAVLAGCAGKGMKPITELSHKQKAIILGDVWSAQYDQYIAMQDRANLTEDQKAVMRIQRKALMEMKPLLNTYATYADTGAIPPADIEAHLFRLLDELTRLAAEK